MDETRETILTIGEGRGGRAPNFTLENCQFFGKPNFGGVMDQFKDDRRKFNVVIPEAGMEPLRALGYNVKQTVPKPEDIEMGREPITFLKVLLNFKIPDDKKGLPNEIDFETGPDIYIMQGEDVEKINSLTVAVLDRTRFDNIDMEIRGWEYDKDENPGVLSARLVQFVGVMRPNMLAGKYGNLR